MKQRMKIELDPLLETGDADIDAQHRELFARVDRLLEASHEARGASEIGALLDFLGDYVVTHFAAEERRMAESGYPDAAAEAHRQEHRRFVEDYGILYRQFRNEGPQRRFVIRVSDRVTSWLREHIYRTDRAFAEWLRDHGSGFVARSSGTSIVPSR